uniref:Vitellogenin-1-like protein n=1 Tax=Daphnia magna TaxID=35525 RepID=A0A0P4Z2N6_9CRUS
MMTTFRNYADSKNPCVKPIANQLQLLLRRGAHIKTNFFRSSNRVFDFQDQKYGFGGGLQLATIYGEEARAPLIIISGRASYRISGYSYVPLEIMIRLEGVEDAYVGLFRKLDPKDFKLDPLKDLLQKTMRIVPRQQAPMKMEILLRSQGYTLMYRHMGMEEIAGLMEGKGLVEMMSRGLKMTRNMVRLGGQHISWRANDAGLPVGVGLSTPGFARHQLAYGNVNQPMKLGPSILADLDVTLQVVTYMVAYNPLGVSQGIIKARGSRIHLPANLLVSYSPADSQVESKMNTPTEEKPLSYLVQQQYRCFHVGQR